MTRQPAKMRRTRMMVGDSAWYWMEQTLSAQKTGGRYKTCHPQRFVVL
jgi:hypothetical protein